eukprot:797399-Amphidinium_carterae.1
MQFVPTIVPSADAGRACCYAVSKHCHLPLSAGVAATGDCRRKSVADLSRCRGFVADLSRCRGNVAGSI